MRITLNLATRPFIELRPLFARLRLIMAGLAVLAVLLGVGLYMLDAKAADAEARMESLKLRTNAFEQEKHTNENRMRQPQNMAVLERSQFLNELFAKKSFSWTAVMMDLERVLPAGVQVTSIEPQITTEGEVQIRLRVSGNRDRAVQLVRNLEGSKRFLAPRLANETLQSQETGGGGLAGPPRGVAVQPQATVAPGGVEFDILSGYNPLPLLPEKIAAEKEAKESKEDAAAKKTGRSPLPHSAKPPVRAAAPRTMPVRKPSPEIRTGTAGAGGPR